MVAYADTSFLFSLYAQDANTARAAALAESLSTPSTPGKKRLPSRPD